MTRLAAQQLPPGVNPRAERILEQAAQVAAILSVARDAAPDFGIVPASSNAVIRPCGNSDARSGSRG